MGEHLGLGEERKRVMMQLHYNLKNTFLKSNMSRATLSFFEFSKADEEITKNLNVIFIIIKSVLHVRLTQDKECACGIHLVKRNFSVYCHTSGIEDLIRPSPYQIYSKDVRELD